MKKKNILIVCYFAVFFTAYGQSGFVLSKNIKRIVFLGNSITYAGHYVDYIETCLLSQYPDRRFEIINMGLPSETVSGLSEPGHANGKFPRPVLRERLERILKQLKPDLILACYGMNDGIYMPFDEFRFTEFKEGIIELHEQVVESGAGIIHLTPPVFDPEKGSAYANVLDIYSAWMVSKRFTSGWKVIDIHWPMRKFLEDKRNIDPGFRVARDGVHPDKTGHWIMAAPVVSYLGIAGLEDTESIQDAMEILSLPDELLSLVSRRSIILKDSWLSCVGHMRPGMKKGLPKKEAIRKVKSIDKEIKQLR